VTLPADYTLPVVRSEEHACSYLPGQSASLEFTLSRRMTAGIYEGLLERGYRRSGRMFYRPVCTECRECQPVRVLTAEFRPDRSMRRAWQRNQDLIVTVRSPTPSREKLQLYGRYLAARHDKEDGDGLVDFLYRPPVPSREIEFRLADRLVCAAICDVVPSALSAVYTYFDPDLGPRGLGTFAVLWQIEHCRQLGKPFLYLGYFVRDCRKMNYKRRFRPHEMLSASGVWSRFED